MQRITNKNYREFLDHGIIKTIGPEEIEQAINNTKGKHKTQATALILILYYTGCRPNEALKLRSTDIKKEGTHLIIQLPASKNGLPRQAHLPLKLPHTNDILELAKKTHPEILLFHMYQNRYVRNTHNKKGEAKQYIETGDKLRYHFAQWFKGIIDISPYYLRHNRFSKLAEQDATAEEIRLLKGAKSLNSVTPYLHLSSKAAKKIGRKIR